MEKPLEVQQLADKYSKSLTGDTYFFEQFLIEYLQGKPEAAFGKLYESTSNVKTHDCAEEFNRRYVHSVLDRIEDEVAQYKPIPSYTKQTKIIQDFFQEYREHGDFNMAWENVKNQVQQDPELKEDKAFKIHLNDIAKKVRPEQKVKKNMNLHEDDAVFVKVRLGLPTRYEDKRSDLEIRQIIKDSLQKFYTSHATDDSKKPIVNIDHEVDSIHRLRQIPLALQLVHADASRLTKQLTVQLRQLDARLDAVKQMEAKDIKFKGNFDNALNDFASKEKEARQKLSTDKVEIIRDLISDMQKTPVSEAFDSAIRKASEYGDPGLLDMLKKNHGSVERSAEMNTSMLLETYALYLKGDITAYREDVKTETENLMTGIKSEAVKLGVRELEIKGKLLRDTTKLSEGIQKEINAALQKGNERKNSKDPGTGTYPLFEQDHDLQKTDDSISAAVVAVAEKNSLLIDLESARAEINKKPDQDQGLAKDNDFELNLN